ncbi:PspC domain-containing protein [Plantactinospora soyae]|uniref:Phage shock protein PspC (Stress-responsive transcriptional regulator) n=1 Tax=Plantactinospora soyae TaxID=1544732 RepID=A0A927M3X4_9ACTN|nr:PspC domain-containing protein [Plantactinospora soyae]MBE1485033.1 phage shock protein PspC (stress-responsive transcriptional regulator) [Plantactinospora soyae]
MTDDAAATRGTPGPEGGPDRADSPGRTTGPDRADDHPTPAAEHPTAPGEPAGPTGPADGPPAPAAGPDWTPPPGPTGTPPPEAGGTPPSAGSGGTPPPGAGWTPPPGPGDMPPGFGFTQRYGLVRPSEGRYLAGVCAAIGRATNSDPILWRVLLAVLGFFGGIGILVYLAAWLIIPSEGDTASPVESMLGRGRSSMSPVTVLVLGILVALMFGFIVTDAFRAVLLGAAVLICGALLLHRDPNRAGSGWQPGAGGPPPPTGPPVGYPGQPYPGQPYTGQPYSGQPYPPATPGAGHPGWYAPAAPATAPSGSVGQPVPAPPPPPAWPTGYAPTPAAPPAPPLGVPPTPTGYRPPFAPHGPYATAGTRPAPVPPRKTKQPKRPRERSSLGAATFSMIFVAIGLVAILDLSNLVRVMPSTYFAAVLVTIALGLLVGAWFGRARWLIALGLVAACALGISTVAESYTKLHSEEDVVWAPASYEVMADRYETRLGSATLDLTRVEFAGRDAKVSVDVDLGEVKVILPPNVDVTVRVDVSAGDAYILGHRYGNFPGSERDVTDYGNDGAGGGRLLLSLEVNAASAEVTR